MLRYMLSICYLMMTACLAAGQTLAQDCPEYFRFVDFGVSGGDGPLHRGGPTFKVKTDSKPLFEIGAVACTGHKPVHTDGHNQPIALVTALRYAPHLVDPRMTNLSVTRVAGASAKLALAPAQPHNLALNAPGVETIKGAVFLCVTVGSTSSQEISCEVMNPFDARSSFIVVCDEKACVQSAKALAEAIMVSATWTTLKTSSLKETGEAASAMAAKIHTLLKDKTSH